MNRWITFCLLNYAQKCLDLQNEECKKNVKKKKHTSARGHESDSLNPTLCDCFGIHHFLHWLLLNDAALLFLPNSVPLCVTASL